MLGGGYFEIRFTNEPGKTLTLSRQYKFNNHDMFTKWCIDFNLKTTYDSNLTNLSIWVQLWGLRHIFRTSQLFIKALHKNTIGEIIVIDPFKSYCSKIVKPWVRMLVLNITKLLQILLLFNFTRRDKEYKIKYTRLPTHCNHCCNTSHHAKNYTINWLKIKKCSYGKWIHSIDLKTAKLLIST